MVDFDSLKVSLTKNGFFKVAQLLRGHTGIETLEHLRGDHPGINLVWSQVANILDYDSSSRGVPRYWDAIRLQGTHAIDAFYVVAMIFSHHRLISLMQRASQDHAEFKGRFRRSDFSQEKEFTNWSYTMACFGLAPYKRGGSEVDYDLTGIVYHLEARGELVGELLKQKLRRAGWRDPSRFTINPDREFMVELRAQNINRVFSMTWPRFARWLDGDIECPEPTRPFGLEDTGLFE